MEQEGIDKSCMLVDNNESCVLFNILTSMLPDFVAECVDLDTDLGYDTVRMVRDDLEHSMLHGAPIHVSGKEKIAILRLVEIGIKFREQIGPVGCHHTPMEHQEFIDEISRRIRISYAVEFTEKDRTYLKELNVSL
ncbi:MAG: hypothetical protein KGJ89_02015 [Patescibacteria group bacterium]|nr:hypothetical protein [Patescibacteria group bacterium]MDE2015652.1 hypothetical protein [Patescibacteria group bacterium]MDE2226709.1 hypothetical protein [Patescibacteria group bacterium]